MSDTTPKFFCVKVMKPIIPEKIIKKKTRKPKKEVTLNLNQSIPVVTEEIKGSEKNLAVSDDNKTITEDDDYEYKNKKTEFFNISSFDMETLKEGFLRDEERMESSSSVKIENENMKQCKTDLIEQIISNEVKNNPEPIHQETKEEIKTAQIETGNI